MSFIKREISRFAVAISGFFHMLATETHAKIHLLATIVAVSVSYLLDISKSGWLWIGLAFTLVWITEALNTAIERLADYAAGTERHPLIKAAKDTAAAAVLLAALFALIVALVIWL
ncbi:MAG: diacylglycerol kinase family protein [Verrucomicrobiota bacterium]